MNAILTLISAIFCALPERAIGALSSAIGFVWFRVLRYRRGVMLGNLARAFPDRSEDERRRLGGLAARHLARTLLEFLRIPRYRREGFSVVRWEGIEHYDAAKAKGRGVLCLSGHLGSFELAVAGVAERAHPVWLVVKPFSKGTDAFVNRIRRGSKLGVIHAEGAAKPIMRALKNNEAVVFVLDQNATRGTGVFVDFFAEEACTMSALALLALRTKATVIAATPYRGRDGTHVLKVLPEIPLEEKETREATVRHMTQVYTRVIEDAIRAHPEQWFWSHKRWRTRPSPSRNSPSRKREGSGEG